MLGQPFIRLQAMVSIVHILASIRRMRLPPMSAMNSDAWSAITLSEGERHLIVTNASRRHAAEQRGCCKNSLTFFGNGTS